MNWFIKKGCQILGKWIRQIILLFFVFSIISCGFGKSATPDSTPEKNNSNSEQRESTSSENNTNNQQKENDRMGVPDPAAVKCSDDGYESRPVNNEYGVPSYYMCYNPQTEKQCEQWAYYRGECSLK